MKLKKFEQPITVTDKEINYLQRYGISGGKKWSDSFSKASNRTRFFSTGAYDLRHSYAQERTVELNALGFKYKTALETISQEMGHFRPEITEVYLR
ncbi:MULTISPECIES: hypothetical protein [unclassified Pseudoalteromonas]|uniref:hypothetical protein n=1 Tax=unclassified Pseudoalteromonas TaxID=194690 RepID=UPI0025B4CF9D|nr:MULTISPECIES: hypothetical protein [unclassified Pseudoalteromonas]MDN3377367.1 hypothetical protein [Pseudoalteromonas sp. APC 3893]MDN3385466.1 hypothetical protein [Pseudoalteromonas sp. APC 4017]